MRLQDLEDIKAKLQASWDLFNDCMKAALTIQQLEGPATPAKLITQPAARDFWEKYFQTVIHFTHLFPSCNFYKCCPAPSKPLISFRFLFFHLHRNAMSHGVSSSHREFFLFVVDDDQDCLCMRQLRGRVRRA
jgi:hypothetical protein